MIDLCKLATEHGLEVIRTTSGFNDFPKNVKKAIIGFESFSKAEELANVEKTKDETMLYSNYSEQWTIGIIPICKF